MGNVSQQEINKVYDFINLSQKDIYKALGVKEKTLKYGQIIDYRQKSD